MTVIKGKYFSCKTQYENDIEIIAKQWLEYSTLYIKSHSRSKKVLKELNDTLISKQYLLGNSPTSADSLIFQSLYQQMSKLTYQEKEQFIHLSRWYNNLQQDANTNSVPIKFSRSSLY